MGLLEEKADAMARTNEVLELRQDENDRMERQREAQKASAEAEQREAQLNSSATNMAQDTAFVERILMQSPHFSSSPSVTLTPSKASSHAETPTVSLIEHHRLLQHEREMEKEARARILKEALLQKRLEESQRVVEQQRNQLSQQEHNLVEMTAQRLALEKGYQKKIDDLTVQLAESKRKFDALVESSQSKSERFTQLEQNLVEMTAQRLAVEKGYKEKIDDLTVQLAISKRNYDTLAKSTKLTSKRFQRMLALTKSTIGT